MNLIDHLHKSIATLELPHTFLIAVSGGSDSMILLHLFNRLRIPFQVAHVNYGFREEAADEESIVMNFCIKNHIPLHVLKLDGYAEMKKGKEQNLQNYAREKRYEFFHSILITQKLQYIVTAHHALDNAETVLMNIFHSTSFLGLKGMETIENRIFRPLLNISKDEIEAYAEENRIVYGVDSSNLQNDYKRNFIRNEIIPSLEKQIPTLKKNLQESISQWNSVIHFYMQMIENHIQNLIKYDAEKKIYFFKFKKLLKNPYHTDIAQLLLHKYQFTQNQIPELFKLFTSKNNGTFIQNSSYRFLKQNELIFIIQKEAPEQDYIYEAISMEELKNGNLLKYHSHLGTVHLQLRNDLTMDKLIFDKQNFYINADKILETDELILRNVQTGDYFYPFGLNKKKKLNKYFIDQKLPIPLRDKQLVLIYDKYILSVINYTIDHRFACTNDTKNVLHIFIEE